MFENFWRNVDKSGGEDACWPWKRALGKNGYGRTTFNGKGTYAHRVACELTHGPAPADKPFALHSRRCASRACCNGAHLRWGTPQENMDDREAVGRTAKKLSNAQVAEMRAMWNTGNYLQKTLAEMFGISVWRACKILKGRKRVAT